MLPIKSIRDLELKGKTVFMRVDFNVPLSAGEDGTLKVDDDTRIREALPTIQLAVKQEARLILASHLGRPGGKKKAEFSLEPVAAHLAELLNQDVTLADDCIGDSVELMIKGLKNGQILMLENLRFYADEEKNDLQFATHLSKNAEVYINDAFGTSHRKHASVYGVPSRIPVRGMGLLIEKEIKFLEPIVQGPAKPFITVLGGSKVSDKIKTVEALLRQVQGICVGGAMAYAFMAAKNLPLPANAKQPSPEEVDCAKSILREASKKEIPLLLPVDTLDSYDIGPKTVELFEKLLGTAKTIFWNGPVGWFEKPEYSAGTFGLAKFVSTLPAVKVVGGGDTVSAINASGFAAQFDHLSTGGGAVLEYLEGNGLPGIDVLKTYR